MRKPQQRCSEGQEGTGHDIGSRQVQQLCEPVREAYQTAPRNTHTHTHAANTKTTECFGGCGSAFWAVEFQDVPHVVCVCLVFGICAPPSIAVPIRRPM